LHAADQKKEEKAMITFKSIGHFFATAWTALQTDEPKVESALTKVEKTEGTVEMVSSAAAPVLVPIEKVAYAVLGEISALLASGDAAAAKKLSDAGLDVNVVTTVQNLLKTAPNLVTVAKAL